MILQSKSGYIQIVIQKTKLNPVGLLLPIITVALLLYADFKSRKKLRKDFHGKYQLKLNKSYKWVGFACCLIGSFLLNAAITAGNEEIYAIASVAILMFFVLGILILIWYYNYEVVFDDNKVTLANWKGKKSTFNWIEIENLKFNTSSGYLKVYTKSNKHLVFQHSVGFVEFLKMMESKTRFRL